jgi:hypothetical protein
MRTGNKLLTTVQAKSSVATTSAGVTGNKLLTAVRAKRIVTQVSA